MTDEQEIAKLKAEIERLKGEISGLKYAVAVQPYPIQYVPTPTPMPRPYQPYTPFFPAWTVSSGISQADACTQSLSPEQVRLQQAQTQVMN